MGKGLALRQVFQITAACAMVVAVAACGNDKGEPSPMATAAAGLAKSTLARVTGKGAAAQPTASTQPTRAELENYGLPILRAVIESRGADALVTITDTKGRVVTWSTTDGTSFALRDGVLIQTRGLGPDLMSAAVPPSSALRQNGSSHQRSYFFLGEDDQSMRRDYTCTVSLVGTERVQIYGREHEVIYMNEVCVRPEGKITNQFWFEGPAIRKSRQWASPGTGYIDFEKAVD